MTKMYCPAGHVGDAHHGAQDDLLPPRRLQLRGEPTSVRPLVQPLPPGGGPPPGAGLSSGQTPLAIPLQERVQISLIQNPDT
jgi:hypothetical protein